MIVSMGAPPKPNIRESHRTVTSSRPPWPPGGTRGPGPQTLRQVREEISEIFSTGQNILNQSAQ
jgi:hypothetical protein